MEVEGQLNDQVEVKKTNLHNYAYFNKPLIMLKGTHHQLVFQLTPMLTAHDYFLSLLGMAYMWYRFLWNLFFLLEKHIMTIKYKYILP